MARKAKAPSDEGPVEGPPGTERYDSTLLPIVEVRLSPERRLSYRLPKSHARWQGDFPDLGALSQSLLDVMEPPLRIQFVTEPESKAA